MSMYNILVVDDKEAFRREIIRISYFQKNRDKFLLKFFAQNGVEAIEILNEENVDIVLTDIRMPYMDGITLLKEIKRKSLCQCTVLLSEYTDFAYAKEGIVNGAFDYIVKPVDDEKLQNTFGRVFTYLNGLKMKETTYIQTTEKLAKRVLDNSPVVPALLETLVKQMKQMNLSFSELTICGINILETMKQIILEQSEFLKLYITLEEICTINETITTEYDFWVQFNLKLTYLWKKVSRFSIKVRSETIHNICHYMLVNTEKGISLQVVADVFYLNNSYLSTMFRKEMGISFVEYENFIKIERAKMLVACKGEKVYEIAENLGFSDTEYFSKVFKKHTGISPKSFCWEREKL